MGTFLVDGALALVCGLALMGLCYLVYLAGKDRAVRASVDQLEADAKATLARLDAQRWGRRGPQPLRVRYRLQHGSTGNARGGTATFYAFTFADWSRDSVHKAMRASLEAENPGWEVVGYAAVSEGGIMSEEVCP